MSRPRGFWWSPDSRSLLYQQTEESAVAVRYIADALHPEAAPTTFFYPRAGTPNATVRLFLLSLRANQATPAPTPIPWDHVAFPYLAHVTWQKYAPPTLLVQNREQTDQRLLAVDSATGTITELLRETDAAWLNLDDNAAGSTGERRPPLWLEDGESFLWTTERRGAWQVELRAASGALLAAASVKPNSRNSLPMVPGRNEIGTNTDTSTTVMPIMAPEIWPMAL